jgi:peptide-methionine (S)-S-oxide reductase
MSEHLEGKLSATQIEKATLGGGCFWCLEPVFEELEGVLDVVVGYAGGMTPEPDYKQVCTGMTGHAEVVQISFDPKIISYRELLEVFFSVHDPTTLNRQGADVGTQYRSIILYHDEQQKDTAEQFVKELSEEGVWSRPIVTEILSYQVFYQAEEYHQEYYKKNPYQGYCAVVISPKLAKFRKKYRQRLKEPQA